MYTDKTKLYGVATIRKKRFVTLVCHGCLGEFESTKEYQKEVLDYYDKAVKEQNRIKKEQRTDE
jgi:hypothetical protein